MWKWIKQTMGITSVVLGAVATVAVGIMMAPVSIPTIATTIATFVACSAGVAALITGSFCIAYQEGIHDERELNLDRTEELRAATTKMAGISRSAASVGQANDASRNETSELTEELAAQKGTIGQQQLEITNLNNRVQSVQQQLANEQLNNQRQLAGIQSQINELRNGNRREPRQNNAIPSQMGIFSENTGMHPRRRSAANDAHTATNEANGPQQ